jgi:hypothetical protein
VRKTVSTGAATASRAVLSRYSHVPVEATWQGLDEIGARQRAADEKRETDAELPALSSL